MCAGAIEKLQMAKQERIKRLKVLVDNIAPGRHAACSCETGERSSCELHTAVKHACDLFMQSCADDTLDGLRQTFCEAFEQHADTDGDYIATVQSLPDEPRECAHAWLFALVDAHTRRAGALLPSLRLFRKKIKG